MALGFRFVNSHSHPFSCSVKDRIHLPQFTIPLLPAGMACQLHSRMQKRNPTAVDEAVNLNNASLLLDKIPEKRVSSTKDSLFAENIEFPEQGTRDTGDLTVIDPPGNVLLLPDRQHVIGALLFCGGMESLELGRIWHALIIKTGLAGDQFVVATLVGMYAKCEKMDDALMVLDKMSCVNVVSCNSLISGYSRNGLLDQALRFFVRMESMLIEPNQYTYSILLSLCEKCSAIKEGHQLHAWILKRGYLPHIAVGNALLTMYCNCGMMKKAKVLFETLPQRNLITWTAFINGSYRNGDFEEALRQFQLMRESGIEPNEYTFTVVLASCASMQHFEGGCMIHAQVIKKRMDLDVHVGTAIIDMYSALGEMDDAQKQFRGMGRTASIVTWNALLAGFVHNELNDEAIKAFHKMVEDDIVRDEFTYSIMLKASSSLPSLSSCEQIHSRVIKANLNVNAHVGSSLVEAYAQCGNLEDADRIFSQISEPDVVECGQLSNARKLFDRIPKTHESRWIVLIGTLAHRGFHQVALEVFGEMQREGIRPSNALIFMYSKWGLVGKAENVFYAMIEKDLVALNALVSGYAQQGFVREALELVERMKAEGLKPNVVTWNTLVASFSQLGDESMVSELFQAMQVNGVKPDVASWT
ncbi:Pentatricopeptide repeat [Dillenia turbinata]|uniref:Pentatricopeptide repeat n=1 Tax=Dillenia turbinata TaxID=194707 RepID=A0AAN8V1Y8_9MAGN